MNSIRTQLNNLDEYITTTGCDIIKFNEHVKQLLEQLNVHGGETQDLLTNLFKAYMSVKDARFIDYVNEKIELVCRRRTNGSRSTHDIDGK